MSPSFFQFDHLLLSQHHICQNSPKSDNYQKSPYDPLVLDMLCLAMPCLFNNHNYSVHQIALQSKMYLLTWAASLAGNKHICPHAVTQRYLNSLASFLHVFCSAIRGKSKMKHESQTLAAVVLYIKISVGILYQPMEWSTKDFDQLWLKSI